MRFETMSHAQGSVHIGPSLRNRIPILLALKRVIDPDDSGEGLSGYALDLSGGTGAHLEVMAPGFPTLEWRATEYVSPESPTHGGTALDTINAFSLDIHSNVQPALPLDLSAPFSSWHESLQSMEGKVQLILNCNVIHITPWAVAEGLLDGAGRLLKSGGFFALYGPFIEDGTYSSAGNRSFDAVLRDRDPSWGLRELSEVCQRAAECGLTRTHKISMPANNLLLIFTRA